MKIIKKPVLPNQLCTLCGCEFKVKLKDLKYDCGNCTKDVVYCPICRQKIVVKFKNKENINE